ncbi:MAG: helix-turn-helix domain-containing protein [Chloroflexota bacterium]|nr:helix-turn-helix domain-containing protein [Chloroflexota bacterium]
MVTEDLSRFGEMLRRYRATARLTQEALAEKAGLSQVGVAALESGRRLRPHPHTVRALSDALELSEDQRVAFETAVPWRGSTGSSFPISADRTTTASLPRLPTELVGRSTDLEAVGALLRGNARLVTVTGPGGVGKTSLALQLAHDLSYRFPDGVHMVALAPLLEASLVIPALVRSLALSEAGGRRASDILEDYLRHRQMLLVLDNFEHVADAATLVAELVRSSDHLRVLVTSRVPLRIRGERQYALRPLAVPQLSRVPGVEEVVGNPAVELFVERAKDAAPDFELTEANATALAAICRRLDGLPLAIELAAARLRALTPTELLARLDRSLPQLTEGARDLPKRQRTMRATIEWSYQLLQEPQWRLLNRLSVFRGGWDLEAAEAVGADGDTVEEEMLDLLTSLVEQSLVVAEVREGGATRYRILEPLREFAWERLQESGEETTVSERHAAYYGSLAERGQRLRPQGWGGGRARSQCRL